MAYTTRGGINVDGNDLCEHSVIYCYNILDTCDTLNTTQCCHGGCGTTVYGLIVRFATFMAPVSGLQTPSSGSFVAS